MTDDNRIVLEQDGQLLAQATLSDVGPDGQVQAAVHVEPGQLPVGTRRELADQVHEHLVTAEADHLSAAVPLGDAELIDRMQDHLSDVSLRAAGASSMVEGDVDRG
jgi:hypothetical protein